MFSLSIEILNCLNYMAQKNYVDLHVPHWNVLIAQCLTTSLNKSTTKARGHTPLQSNA